MSTETGRLYYGYDFESLIGYVNTKQPRATLPTMDLPRWQSRLQAFTEARSWAGFHNPKNLAMALSVEAAELLECYQWLSADQAVALTEAAPGREAVADEMADVMLYLLQLARVTGIDLEQALERKFAKNALKYPAP